METPYHMAENSKKRAKQPFETWFNPILGYNANMKIISLSTLKAFWEQHPDAEQPLKAWHAEAKAAQWRDMHDIKRQFGTASVLKNNRVVFNIKGNHYRLIVSFWFSAQYAYIKFIGTHAQYDQINAETVEP